MTVRQGKLIVAQSGPNLILRFPGSIRRAQGTATTSNRQIDYSTQVSSNSSNNNNPSAERAQQLAADEELARRLQRQEVLEARREENDQEEGPVPFRYNLGFFNPSTRSGMRDSQSFDHDDIGKWCYLIWKLDRNSSR